LDNANDRDLEVGNEVAIDIAADNRDVVGGACLVEGLVTQFARPAVKILCADELETLVTGAGGVRIDIPEIDVVQSRLEVGDEIAVRGPDRGLVERIEVEDVAISTTGERVAAKTAGEAVVASAAAERIGAAVADQGIGERRARDVLDAYEPL
jgi:hypothetical protein